MAKTTGPLLSFGAAGQIGHAQVYSRWRGIPYARRYVTPANPRTTAQTQTRSVFATISRLWSNYVAGAQAPWTAYSLGKPLTNRNAILRFNVAALRPGTDWSAFVGSPGSGGAPGIPSVTVTGGTGTITATPSGLSAPTGWTISAVSGIARKNDDPHTTTDYSSVYQTATSSPYAPNWTGLDPGSYMVSVWPVYTDAQGVTQYGPSTTQTVTVT